jgi:crossover junction endodeoxyribonuclease RuvC
VATGFGVIAGGPAGITVLDSGVISTRAEQPLDARILEIYEGVQQLLDAYAPAMLVLEDLYAEYKFPRTALQMAHARGVVCLAARQGNVAVLALAPAEVKRAVSGNGAASKAQIQHCVQRLLRLPQLPKPSHIADALALAFTGFSRGGYARHDVPRASSSALPLASRMSRP